MIAALIPLKEMRKAKSRLAAALSPAERERLVLALLSRTLDAVRDSGVVDRIALTTPDERLAAVAGVEWVPDAGSLNASLQAGVAWALGAGAEILLILPADLPLITAGDVTAVVGTRVEADGVTVAPCLDGGTGALVLRPPNVLPPSFGPDSYSRHETLALRSGVPVTVLKVPGLARDLDRPDDLGLFQIEGASSAVLCAADEAPWLPTGRD